MLTREKTLEAGQAMVINPFGHGHNTKMVKIPFLNWFGPRYLLLNYKFFLTCYEKLLIWAKEKISYIILVLGFFADKINYKKKKVIFI